MESSGPQPECDDLPETQGPHDSVIKAIIDMATEAGAEVIKLGEGQLPAPQASPEDA